MDRRYYRKYENFDTVVPRIEDFPILNSSNQISSVEEDKKVRHNKSDSIKTDDLLLMVVLIILLMEEEKDLVTILGVAALLFADYIF